MELQVGDILLKKGTALGAVLIRELTRDGEDFDESYSHCGIVASVEGDRVMIYDSRFPTVDLRPLDYELYDVYRIELTDDEKQKLIESCASKIGEHYALSELFAEGIEMLTHIPMTFTFDQEDWCSTFVNHRFTEIKRPITRKIRCTPNDISWSVVGKIINAS